MIAKTCVISNVQNFSEKASVIIFFPFHNVESSVIIIKAVTPAWKIVAAVTDNY